MYGAAGSEPGLLRRLRELVSVLTARSVGDHLEVGVEDPAIQAQKAVDGAFPKTSARALRQFHDELVAEGTITDQAAVTYGIRFLEYMLGTETSWDTDDDEDEDEDD